MLVKLKSSTTTGHDSVLCVIFNNSTQDVSKLSPYSTPSPKRISDTWELHDFSLCLGIVKVSGFFFFCHRCVMSYLSFIYGRRKGMGSEKSILKKIKSVNDWDPETPRPVFSPISISDLPPLSLLPTSFPLSVSVTVTRSLFLSLSFSWSSTQTSFTSPQMCSNIHLNSGVVLYSCVRPVQKKPHLF